MKPDDRIYILGAGAVGIALAGHLAEHGKQVSLVRTSIATADPQLTNVIVQDSLTGTVTQAQVEVVSLAQLEQLTGTIVITAKTYANADLAVQLRAKILPDSSPVVLLQNGIGIEAAYVTAGFPEIYRCVLYMSSQTTSPYTVSFKALNSSPIGLVQGSQDLLEACVQQLSTPAFPFVSVDNITREVWRKGIVNATFNTIYPLIDTDNGAFARSAGVRQLAQSVLREGIAVAQALGLELDFEELSQQVMSMSQGSQGQLISTLQDLQHGRQTEIASLNVEIARVAASLTPPVAVPQLKLLGELVLLKSSLARTSESS